MRSQRSLRGQVARAQRARRPVVVVIERDGGVHASPGAPLEVEMFARDLKQQFLATQQVLEERARGTDEALREIRALLVKAGKELAPALDQLAKTMCAGLAELEAKFGAALRAAEKQAQTADERGSADVASDHSADVSKMMAAEPVTPEAPAPAAPEVSAAVAAPMPVVPAQMVPIPPVRLSDRRHMGRWLIGMQQRLRLNREGLAERIGLPLSVFRALPQGTLVNQETSQRVVEAWLDREAPGWRDAAPPASVAASSTPNAPKPPALGQLEPVPASIKDAEDWLYEEVVRERGKRANHAEIEARIAMFTPEGLLREVNARRLKHGLPPYVISGRAA